MPSQKKVSSSSKESLSKESLPKESLPTDWSYEDTLARIEDITAQLETGDMPIADVFEQFAEAVGSLKQCDRFLQDRQKEAALLIETLVDGDEAEASD